MGDKVDKKRIHWVAGDKIYLSKERGGLGVKIDDSNVSLLLKWCWKNGVVG